MHTLPILIKTLLIAILFQGSFLAAGPSEPSPIFQKDISSVSTPIFVCYLANDRVYTLIFSPRATSEGLFEVVEATEDTLEREGLESWQKWIELGMPSALMKRSYIASYDNSVMLKAVNNEEVASSDPLYELLSQLFTKSLRPALSSERKKIGPQPSSGEIDRRPFWQPPISFQGHPVAEIPSDVYVLEWPKDGSELEGKKFLIYMANKNAAKDLPAPFLLFPTWVESEGRLLLKARVIDSGRSTRLAQ